MKNEQPFRPSYGVPMTASSADRNPGIVDDFAASVNALQFEVDRLYEQLAPVTVIDNDPVDAGAAGVSHPPQSAAREAHTDLLVQVRRIEYLRSRLEV